MTERPNRHDLIAGLAHAPAECERGIWHRIDPDIAADAILGDEPIDWISDDTIADPDSIAAWVARAILTDGPWWVVDICRTADDMATEIIRADMPAGTRLAPSMADRSTWGIGWWSADGTESGGIGAPIGTRDDTIDVLAEVGLLCGDPIGDDNTVVLS